MKNLPYKRTRAKKVRKVIFVIQNYEFDFSDKLFDLDHQKFELLMFKYQTSVFHKTIFTGKKKNHYILTFFIFSHHESFSTLSQLIDFSTFFQNHNLVFASNYFPYP